jgi:phosphoribosylglycinamide formyltransferase-1
MKKIVILFSGDGSNLENIIKKLHLKSVKVVQAITNNSYANGISKAEILGVRTTIIDHKNYKTRELFDTRLVGVIKSFEVDLVVLAGFMRILTPLFTDHVKAINIHPSLLPDFKGANAQKRSFKSEKNIVGVTVHKVVTEVDGGEIIMQKSFDKSGMDYDAFIDNIHKCEHDIFPKSIEKILNL